MNEWIKKGLAQSLFMLIALLAQVSLSSFTYAADNITYYHNDALGSPAAATDQAGNVLWKEEYKPYGRRIISDSSSDSNDIWFTGKPEESDLGGIQYYGARWYHSDAGRFMGIDPVGFSDSNLQSFNKYAYANNNPYKYVDPNGESPLDLAFLAVDLVKLGGAIRSGQGVGGALVDVGFSVVGVISPVPGVGQIAKAGVIAGKGAKLADKASDTTTGGDTFTKQVIKRNEPGRDGGQSQHVVEKVNGETNSTTHQVFKDGKTIHQHQDHVGKHGTVRRFSDELTGTKTIAAPKTKDTMKGGRLGSPPKS